MRRGSTAVEIFDPLRRRWVTLTPEEWVRQNFTAYLIDHLGYPAALMGNEISLTQNGIARRCDTLVADAAGRPLMIIEYKAPMVALSQAVIDQALRYVGALQAPYLAVSNGLEHHCYHIDFTTRRATALPSIPRYDLLCQP